MNLVKGYENNTDSEIERITQNTSESMESIILYSPKQFLHVIVNTPPHWIL